jgi:hypothetical protein
LDNVWREIGDMRGVWDHQVQRPRLRRLRYPLLKVQRVDMILKTSLGTNLKGTDDLLLPLRALRTWRPFLGEWKIGLLFSGDRKKRLLPPFHLLSDLKMEVLGKVSRTSDLSWSSACLLSRCLQ